jgi:spore maturation protein CgeB
MKILVVNSSWVGGWMDYVVSGLKANGYNVTQMSYERKKSVMRIVKMHNIIQIRDILEKQSWDLFNKKVKKTFDDYRPDIFITMNESYLLPDTLKYVNNNGCKTVCFIADNPFDSYRFTFLPISLKYFSQILVSDKIWIQAIRNVSPSSKIVKIPSGGGFSEELFYPVGEDEISDTERIELSCDISFTGESYGIRAEGGYRAGILDQLSNYKLKIWGDKDWHLRFPYYDNLRTAYQGRRLSFDKLRKLYRLSTINLNMPSPQIFTGFQPRVFEIAACKGFQIVDWREEIDELFNNDEIVTFKSIPDLKDKIEYFLKNPDKRQPYVDRLFVKVWNNYTWAIRAQEIIDVII